MIKKLRSRFERGDTLIEVTIAIGIFSLIAVMAVLVVNTSISGTQSALENTVTREEINTQAEALRFIQAAYIADKNNSSNEEDKIKYSDLWKAIMEEARTLSDDEGTNKEILSYRPATCGEPEEGAFIVNVRALGSGELNNVLLFAKDEGDKFIPTTTYPRILYGYEGDEIVDDEDEALYNPVSGDNVVVQRVEGIYVIAVKDYGSTSIISGGATSYKGSAFVDFYIRTCWYTMNSEKPSTISTVIRLYDPDYLD